MNIEQRNELLLRRRLLFLTKDITSTTVSAIENLITDMVLEDSKKPITCVIDCCGGNPNPTLYLHDFIKSLPCEINAAIIGKCHSSTLTLLPAFKYRASARHARFAFHAMVQSLEIKITGNFEEQIKEVVQTLKITYEQVMEVQMKGYNLSREDLLELREMGERYDVSLSAEQAKERGIIHSIVDKFNFLHDIEPIST